MPDYHNIACSSCKEFMGTYKWGVPFDYRSNTADTGIPLSKKEIESSVEIGKAIWLNDGVKHWFEGLIPYIESFVNSHEKHEIRFHLEGNCPWYPEEPGYLEWKEILGVEFATSGELFLPRNLIDDLSIHEWSAALDHLKSNTVILLEDIDLNNYKQCFENYVGKRSETKT